MNILSEKKLENAVVELEIEVPVEKVELEYKAVFENIKKNTKLDGFRKGKAPVQMIETKYKEYAGEEVAANLSKSTFFEAVEKNDLAPIVEPNIHYDEIKRNEPFKYKATFEVMPSVELGDYSGLEIDEWACNITDSDVDSEIDSMLERFAETEVLEDAAVENGNMVKFMLKRVDDVPEDAVEAMEFKEYSIVVGKSKDEYTLDKHIVGMKVDEEKKVDIDYPESYYIKDFAGKTVTYVVKIAEISKVKLPELNDEFAVKSGYESLEDMTTKTREYLAKFVGDRISSDVRNGLIAEIEQNSTFDIPESMVMNEMYSIFQKTQQRIGYQAESIDQFATMMGLDPDEYRSKIREDAVKTVKNTLVLSEIVKKEDLKVAEDKYKEVIANLSVQMGKTPEEIEKLIEDNNNRSSVEHDILLDQAMDFIYDNAKIKKLDAVTLEEFVKNKMGQ